LIGVQTEPLNLTKLTMALAKHKKTARENESMLPHNLNLPIVEAEDCEETVAMMERLMDESWRWEEKYRKMKEKRWDDIEKNDNIDDARRIIWKKEVAYMPNRRMGDMDMDLFQTYLRDLRHGMRRGTFLGVNASGVAVFSPITNEHWVILKAMKIRAEYLEEEGLASCLSGILPGLILMGGNKEGLTMSTEEDDEIVGITKERFLDFWEQQVRVQLKTHMRDTAEKRAKRIIADALWDSPGAKRALWRIKANHMDIGQIVKRVKHPGKGPKSYRWMKDFTQSPVVAWLRIQLVDVFHQCNEGELKGVKKAELQRLVASRYRYEGHLDDE
jgi:hypothetical protein